MAPGYDVNYLNVRENSLPILIFLLVQTFTEWATFVVKVHQGGAKLPELLNYDGL